VLVGVTGHRTQRPRGQVGPPRPHPAQPSSSLDPGGERWPISPPLAPLIAQLVLPLASAAAMLGHWTAQRDLPGFPWLSLWPPALKETRWRGQSLTGCLRTQAPTGSLAVPPPQDVALRGYAPPPPGWKFAATLRPWLPSATALLISKTKKDLHRLHCALPEWDAAAERRDAQDELHSAAQARAWADGDFDADHGCAFDGVGRQQPPGSLEPGARPNRGGGGGCARALAVYKPPPPKQREKYPLERLVARKSPRFLRDGPY
jgi:hypothetical protein